MKNKRSDRFKPIHNLAQQKQDVAAQSLGKIQSELNSHHLKLTELIQYYDDYQMRFAQQAVNGMNINQVQSYQNFISQLEIAINEQKKQVNRVTEACDLSRDDWKQERQKTQVLEKTIERFQKQESKENNRKEQRRTDEFVTSQYWHQKK